MYVSEVVDVLPTHSFCYGGGYFGVGGVGTRCCSTGWTMWRCGPCFFSAGTLSASWVFFVFTYLFIFGASLQRVFLRTWRVNERLHRCTRLYKIYQTVGIQRFYSAGSCHGGFRETPFLKHGAFEIKRREVVVAYLLGDTMMLWVHIFHHCFDLEISTKGLFCLFSLCLALMFLTHQNNTMYDPSFWTNAACALFVTPVQYIVQ